MQGLEAAGRQDVLQAIVEPINGPHQTGQQMPVDSVRDGEARWFVIVFCRGHYRS